MVKCGGIGLSVARPVVLLLRCWSLDWLVGPWIDRMKLRCCCCCCCTVDLVGDSQPRLGILRQDIASTMVRPGTVQKRPSICRRVLISFILLFAIAFDRASSFSSSVPPPSPVPRRSDPPRKQSIEYMNRIRNARDWRAGGNVFLDIEQAGYIPNVFHYSAIISKCAKDRRPDKAMGFLKRMTNQGGRAE